MTEPIDITEPFKDLYLLSELDKQRQLTSKDQLTGLENRRSFEEQIRTEINRAIRTGKPLSVVMADINNFKKFNDEEGHLTGDKILESLGAIFKQGIRPTDIACRYGGDEIFVLLPDTALIPAVETSERLRSTTEASTMIIGDKEMKITASFGVSTFSPEASYPHESPEQMRGIINKITTQLIDSVDSAMYTAKKAGKNKIGVMQANGKIQIAHIQPNAEGQPPTITFEIPQSPTSAHT